MFKCIIFDLDGTLLDTITDIANAGNHALNTMKLPTHSIDAYKKMVGNGIPNLVRLMLPTSCNGDASHAIALQLFDGYYTNHMLDYTTPYEGILTMLEELQKQDIKLAVASNKADSFTQEIVDKFFPNTFDFVQGKLDSVPAKPAPDIVYSILSHTNITPENTLFCGDSDVDILTGQAANTLTCGVSWGFRGKNELQNAGANYVVDTVPELTQLIKEYSYSL